MGDEHTTEAARALRTERTIVRVRWFAVVFAFVQVLTYYTPYPPGVLPVALSVVGVLTLMTVATWIATRRDLDAPAVRRLSVVALTADTAVAVAFVAVYTFDPDAALWAVLYIIPLLGAIRFRMRGALGAMAAVALLYTAREVMGTLVYGNDFTPVSITFRMGIGFIIAAVAGSMAESLTRDRARLEEAVNALAQKTAESESMLQALSDAGVGLLIGDGARVLDVNDAHCRITGYTRDELISIPPLTMMDRKEGQRLVEFYRRVLAGEKSTEPFDTWMWRKDGTRVDVELAVDVMRQVEPLRLVTAVRDITERKRLDAMKDSFLSAVSHELRTPLTGVLGFALTLQNERLPDEVRADLIRRVAVNARRLDHLLTDLLDLDRLTAGPIEPRRQPTDVGALVRRLCTEWSMQENRPVITDAPSVIVPVEEAKVERILENLLSNAAKHTPRGSPVDVRLAVQTGGIVLTVEDRGPGVPNELWDTVFEPFQRGAQTSSHSPGVGIGLSIVRRFAELHGGTAWVEDRPGGGASFRVFLPADVHVDLLPVADGEVSVRDSTGGRSAVPGPDVPPRRP